MLNESALTVKFDAVPDERRYCVFSLDSKDACPLASEAGAMCSSTTHKHRVQVLEGYDRACDAVAAERSRGWVVKFMDRTN